MMAMGGASLLFVALPARHFYLRELEEAEDAQWITEREDPAQQAREHRRLMLGSAAVGAVLVALGTVVLSVGIHRRNRLRRTYASTLSVAPLVGGGQLGAGASVRF